MGVKASTVLTNSLNSSDQQPNGGHKLMCESLSKYGMPPTLVEIIKKLYKNCTVKIKVGTKFTEILYSTGVHQGDNMSPVLFLFVMQAFLDTLQLPSPPALFSHFPKNNNDGNTNTQ